MRKIHSDEIVAVVIRAVREANTRLPVDIVQALKSAREREGNTRARSFLDIILANAAIACKEEMALCQDTGLVVVDIELGQEVSLEGDLLDAAVNEGIRQGYRQGFFRNSIVADPFNRINTGDNTPAVIHTRLVPGEQLRLTVLPKGAGSENMGQVAMLKPAQGIEGVKEFILQVVEQAGANPCPPIIVGAGVGGNMEMAAYLAKRALTRPVDQPHPRPELAILEAEMLKRVNATGIGPQGMGGDTTALAVHIEVYPTHIASLPVAVNLGCHSTRRATVVI